MSRTLRSAITRAAPLGGALWLTLTAGCIDGIVIDQQRAAVTRFDAQVEIEEDADLAEPPPEAPEPRDAGRPVPPRLDAGMNPAPKPDAGRDGGRDAEFPPGQDAGGMSDAGCSGAHCDAGTATPPGPCSSCGGGLSVLAQPAATDGVCDNGAPTVCWTNPYGDCTMQCPKTDSCTKDDLGACGPDRFCYFPRSDCGASSAGFCANMPAAKDCADVSAPVCGCDGTTYQNTCVAAAAGTAVHMGLPMEHCR